MRTNFITGEPEKGFSIYIDLFNKGDFSELKVIPENDNYSVLLEEYKLATIKKDSQNHWIRIEGHIPTEKLDQVGSIINLRLLNKKQVS